MHPKQLVPGSYLGQTGSFGSSRDTRAFRMQCVLGGEKAQGASRCYREKGEVPEVALESLGGLKGCRV